MNSTEKTTVMDIIKYHSFGTQGTPYTPNIVDIASQFYNTLIDDFDCVENIKECSFLLDLLTFLYDALYSNTIISCKTLIDTFAYGSYSDISEKAYDIEFYKDFYNNANNTCEEIPITSKIPWSNKPTRKMYGHRTSPKHKEAPSIREARNNYLSLFFNGKDSLSNYYIHLICNTSNYYIAWTHIPELLLHFQYHNGKLSQKTEDGKLSKKKISPLRSYNQVIDTIKDTYSIDSQTADLSTASKIITKHRLNSIFKFAKISSFSKHCYDIYHTPLWDNLPQKEFKQLESKKSDDKQLENTECDDKYRILKYILNENDFVSDLLKSSYLDGMFIFKLLLFHSLSTYTSIVTENGWQIIDNCKKHTLQYINSQDNIKTHMLDNIINKMQASETINIYDTIIELTEQLMKNPFFSYYYRTDIVDQLDISFDIMKSILSI